MPPEWAPHAATWMGFPQESYPGTGVSTDDVQAAWAAVANTIADHEPVHMLVHPNQMAQARKRLAEAVQLHSFELNDAWLRDSGPSFVIQEGELAAVDWRFNGWGDNTSFDWAQDAKIARHIAGLLEIDVVSSALTNEGGGIHVNGQGLVLLTETVQCDPHRNPDWERQTIEAEILEKLGCDTALWFKRGLHRDYEDNGTRGHVDMIACFANADTVLLHRQRDESHPDYQRYAEHRETLDQAPITVVDLPAPSVLRDNRDWVDYSYINHYVLNDAVIMPTFDDRTDAEALEILAHAWPGREIRALDARAIFAMGGGVHCITQQQPAV